MTAERSFPVEPVDDPDLPHVLGLRQARPWYTFEDATGQRSCRAVWLADICFAPCVSGYLDRQQLLLVVAISVNPPDLVMIRPGPYESVDEPQRRWWYATIISKYVIRSATPQACYSRGISRGPAVTIGHAIERVVERRSFA